MGYASKNAQKHNDRISDQEKVYHCAYCKGVVLKTDHYCQYCGKKLRKQSFFWLFRSLHQREVGEEIHQ